MPGHDHEIDDTAVSMAVCYPIHHDDVQYEINTPPARAPLSGRPPPHSGPVRRAGTGPNESVHRAATACPEIATADDDYTKVLSLTGAAPATASGYKICPRADPFTLHASHIILLLLYSYQLHFDFVSCNISSVQVRIFFYPHHISHITQIFHITCDMGDMANAYDTF